MYGHEKYSWDLSWISFTPGMLRETELAYHSNMIAYKLNLLFSVGITQWSDSADHWLSRAVTGIVLCSMWFTAPLHTKLNQLIESCGLNPIQQLMTTAPAVRKVWYSKRMGSAKQLIYGSYAVVNCDKERSFQLYWNNYDDEFRQRYSPNTGCCLKWCLFENGTIARD